LKTIYTDWSEARTTDDGTTRAIAWLTAWASEGHGSHRYQLATRRMLDG
jgi:hypothetical protein